MRLSLFRKLLFHTRYSRDEKVSFLTQDMEFVGDSYIEPVMNIFSWGFVAIITAVYIVCQDVLLGTIFVLFTVLRPIPQFLLNQRLKHSGDSMSQLRTKLHSVVSDMMQGNETIANNQAVKQSEERVKSTNRAYQRAIQTFSFTHNFIFFCNGFMVFLSQVLPLALGFYLSLHGKGIILAKLVAMYIASNQPVSPIQKIMYDAIHIQGAKSTVDKIFSILENDSDCLATPQESLQNIDKLVIQKLDKSYHEKVIFKDFFLTIKMGEKILIKGASGFGKSTLFRLIQGFETFDSGKMLVICKDGVKSEEFRGNVGMISQQPFLFNGSIRYNLTLGQQFTDEDLLAVLKRVNLYDEFQDILNVELINNGENISGGQRVRMEIARFLLREKDILLADEVTAALDPVNRFYIRKLLFSLPITVLEIAHHIEDESRYSQVIDMNS